MRCNTRRSSTPVSTGSSTGFTGKVDIARDAWFHLRLVVAGAQARLYLKDMDQPALVDFARRLEPQPGMKVVYARTRISAERDEMRKLSIGYSDDVSVFLNGQILYRGRSAQNFRDPAFLGIVDPENDVVYLPLKKGSNELVLAVSELGGGWGFICRLADANN